MPAVLYLDRYHLGDPLFLNGFARDVLAFPEPLVIVHGSGEAAERALEAQGRIAEWKDGVLAVETDADRALVERAGRDLNRQIVHTLNDAGVAAVRLDAGSRGLLKATEKGVEAKKIDWLRTLVAQGAVPVILAVLDAEGGPAREMNGGAVAGEIAASLSIKGESMPVLVMAKSGLKSLESHKSVILSELPDDVLSEPEAVQSALETGADVRLIARSDLRSGAVDGLALRSAVDKKSA